MKTPVQEIEESRKVVDLHPSLEEVVSANGLNQKKLTVGLKMRDDNRADLLAREEIFIYDGTKGAFWKVPSLRALFRGDKTPPAMPNEPPPAYMPLFFFIEEHALTFCEGPESRGPRRIRWGEPRQWQAEVRIESFGSLLARQGRFALPYRLCLRRAADYGDLINALVRS